MTTKTFISPNAPKFTIRLCGEYVKFENGCKTFDLDDEDEAAQCAELEKCMKKSPNLTQQVQLVDREAAEKAAKEHLERMKNMGGPISGRMSSSDLGRLSQAAILAQRDEQLKAQGSSPEAVAKLNEELAAADLALTEKTSEIVRNQEGFIKDEVVKTPDLEAAIGITSEEPAAKTNPLAGLGKKLNA